MIAEELERKRKLIDKNLERFLPDASVYPHTIHKAMRYSVFGRGKRLRPILTLAGAEAGRYNQKAVLPAACAVEFIHTFSLIHDDLPGLDNDDFRRGIPACHRAFGEDIAILAGDALLVLGFKLLGQSERIGESFLKPGVLIEEMASAIGTGGMIGGQAVDLENQRKKKTDIRELEYINEKKTAALITAALRIGGIIGRVSPRELSALTDFGMAMGVSFQIIDDLLDGMEFQKEIPTTETSQGRVLSSPTSLADEVSCEKKNNREEAMAKVRGLTLKAEKALKPLGKRGEILKAINKFMISRTK